MELVMKNIITWILSLILISNTLLSANAECFQDNNAQVNIISHSIKASHFIQIDNNYYRGGQPDEEDFKNFAKLGIKTVINLRHPYYFNKEGILKQKAIANGLGMTYINIPMYQYKPPTQEQINYFFSIINNPNNMPVFVHCWQGRDRTGIMTALYRVRCYHWNYDKAYNEMKNYGYHRFLYPRLKHFLRDYTELYQCK